MVVKEKVTYTKCQNNQRKLKKYKVKIEVEKTTEESRFHLHSSSQNVIGEKISSQKETHTTFLLSLLSLSLSFSSSLLSLFSTRR
ncbi:hypothetical protein Hanom_Chr03g00271751 [Helianthus anomalus]